MTLMNASLKGDGLPGVRRAKRCEVCSTPITAARRGRPRRTCSDLCRQHHHRKRVRMFSDLDRYTDRKARAAQKLLRRYERIRGRVDETPYVPGGLRNPRDCLLLDLRMGHPFELCQWCARPLLHRFKGQGSQKHCCSRRCREKYMAFAVKLEDGLLYYEGLVDWAVTLRLRGFNIRSKEPRFVLRFEVNVCAHCNKPYPVGSLTSRFCSKRCRQAAWYRRHHRFVATKRHCLGCGKRFKARFADQKHCGPACRLRYQDFILQNKPGVEQRRCAECGEPFLTRMARQRFCGMSCQQRYHNLRYRARKYNVQKLRERCMWCGEKLPPPAPTGSPRRQTCSRRCQTAAYRMRKKQGIPLPAALARVDELMSL